MSHIETLAFIRKLLLVVLAVGLLGSATDLMLLGHYEDAWQVVPLVLIAVAVLIVVWVLVKNTAAAVTALRITMVLCVASGVIGTMLHFNGNREFQHELDPSLSGWALFSTVMTAKAPPALAPGAMIQLGLIGLVSTYRHPALMRSRGFQ
jgi:hypothetical protein